MEKEDLNKMGYSQSIIDRFWSKVDFPDNINKCWPWLGGPYDTTKKVYYGLFWVNGKSVQATKFSFEYYNGPVPKGLLICHTCDNPKCVNPNHLFLGTSADNMKDRDIKGRNAKGSTSSLSTTDEETMQKILDDIKNNIYPSRCALLTIESQYDVGHRAILAMLRGDTWKHLTSKYSDKELHDMRNSVCKTMLTEDDVRNIRKRLTNGDRQIDIANDYNVGQSVIANIKAKRIWANLI